MTKKDLQQITELFFSLADILEQRIDRKLDARFTQFEQKFEEKIDRKLDERFAQFEEKIDQKLDLRFAEFEKKIDQKLAQSEEKMNSRFLALEEAIAAIIRELTTDLNNLKNYVLEKR